MRRRPFVEVEKLLTKRIPTATLREGTAMEIIREFDTVRSRVPLSKVI